MTDKTIIVTDDDRAIRTVLQQALERAGYTVRLASTAQGLMRIMDEGGGDLLVSDVILPDRNMFDVLPEIRERHPGLPVLVISAQSTLTTAMRASELGAYDYLPKPFDLNDLLRAVANALARHAAESGPVQDAGPSDDGGLGPLVGQSPAMQEIFRSLARVSASDLTVLITGESGTGKELVARALHDHGRRKDGPFVAVTMAAIPQGQMEAELFGRADRMDGRIEGRFARAHGGTLFLDEVGDMPVEVQTRLLRILQDGEHRARGPSAMRGPDVRLVAATNRDLQAMIREGTFRADLFYRLNVVPLRVPALRDRAGDIPTLTEHILHRSAQDGLPPKTVDEEGMAALRRYPWPGNVRELENVLRRLCVLYPETTIGADIIDMELSGGAAPGTAPVSEGQADNLGGAVEGHLRRYFDRLGGELPPPNLHGRIIREVERPLIELTLILTKGNQLKASHILGLNRNTLRKKIKELGIDVMKGLG